MPYVLPQVQVFQEFQTVPAAAANPLRAHISGGHAKLIRYAEDDERALGRLGFYDRLLETAYGWPDRPAGGEVDETYVKLWMKDALLLYFQDTIGTGSTITKTSGYNNRVRSATINFADNGDDYPRAASLLDRDVQVGDIVKVRGINGDDDPVTLWTYVKSLIGDTVAADVGDAEADESNEGTQAASSSVIFVSGDNNCVTLTPDESAYDGLTSGYIDETYDIIVTEGSVNGDFTTAVVRVISGSGEDDVTSVTPEAAGDPTEIGTRGLTVTFDKDAGAACSASASEDAVSPDDLIAGQRWRVTVHAAFTESTATSGGTYDSEEDTTYVITVFRGGLYAADEPPQIMVTTTTGIDISGPTEVTAASTFVDVGTKGITISFGQTGLRKGDRFHIVATGEGEGAMRTIELGHSLDNEIPADSEVDVTLFIKKALLEIPEDRVGFAPTVNWELSDTEITVADSIIAYDATWTDDGVEEPLDVYSEESKDYGELFVEVRYWLSDLCNEVGTIQDVGDIDDLISGALHPDNPLKWGVFKALENSNGTEVKYTSVCDPDDPSSWADVLGLLLGRDDVYEMVPLTRDQTVLDLYVAHVTAMSSPEQALWRAVWVNLQGVPEIPIVAAGSDVPGHISATTSDEEVALATLLDDPDTSGSQYTILRNTNANADFLTNNVQAGDIVRVLFTSDGFGNATYSEYVVDEVIAEDELRLLTGPDAPINVAAKFEIWRNLTATEEAAEIAINGGSYGDRRVRAVWPDTIESSGTVQPGYFLCAALAGLASGVLPHQGLTNVELSGFTDVPRTTSKFNRSQLDAMALGGVWIVTQNVLPASAGVGQIYTRHALTPGDYDDINQREEVATRNVDSISYRFKDYFRPFIGKTNVTPVMRARLEMETGKLITLLMSESDSVDLGPQLIAGEIVDLRPHAVERDRFILELNLTIPYPFNVFEIKLQI